MLLTLDIGRTIEFISEVSFTSLVDTNGRSNVLLQSFI